MVEAAGIEPASRDTLVYASTCLSGDLKVRLDGLPPAGYATSLDRQGFALLLPVAAVRLARIATSDSTHAGGRCADVTAS